MSDFNLKFLNADANNSIPFLPYGVTTIEFMIEGNVPAGYIRPDNSTLNEDDKSYVGFADGTKDFLVVWGAGKEEGQYVKPSSTGRMFMQLIHVKNDYDDEDITFIHSRVCDWRQKVSISRASKGQVVRMKVDKRGEDRVMTFEGSELPTYYSRWFPPRPANEEKIKYIRCEDPLISIEYKEDDAGIDSPLSIFLQTKKICSVWGDLKYSLPHAELFALLPDQNVLVLRLWLYWIHKRYEGNYFYTFEETAGSETHYRKLGQKITTEIPDIERFDFVIDVRKGKVIWYGTDFHYQEHWGRVRGDVADARIAQNLDLAFKTLEMLPFRLRPKTNYNPIASLKSIILGEKKILDFLKLETKEKTQLESQYRALNIRTHVPYVENGETEKTLVSSIVSDIR